MSTTETAAADSPSSMETLAGAARAGDTAAMIEYASRLVIGQDAPIDLEQGLALLARAADLGEARAMVALAPLVAIGATGSADWPRALDYLAKAADRGSAEAQAQLWLLSSRGLSARGARDEDWRQLAQSVDIAAWTTPPARRAVCESPRVRMADAFATPAVCDWLRDRARGRMRPALMYHGDTRTAVIDPHRTCSDYQFDILNTDLVLLLVRERIAALTKLPTVAMEPPRVFHYALGEQIGPHFDRCGDAVNGYGADGGYRGDRIVTFLLYLNDGFEGGELDFPRAGFRCKGVKGDAVYFAHVDLSGQQDPLSLHAGLEITRGEKWVLSQWIHDRPFGVVEPAGP